jgi:low affinity Fe/Cu permease
MEQRLRGTGLPSHPGTEHPPERLSVRDRFNRATDSVTNALGSMPALVASVALVLTWAVTGPFFHFSDTWQLFINTTTTVVTFWMVFVIQNSANRATKSTQLKLDELIRAIHEARNEFIVLDHESEAVMAERERELVEVAAESSPRTGQVQSRRAAQRPRVPVMRSEKPNS